MNEFSQMGKPIVNSNKVGYAFPGYLTKKIKKTIDKIKKLCYYKYVKGERKFMANKVTKKENFLKLKALVTDAELIAFIDNEIRLLEKKNSAKKGPSKTQVENENIKVAILNAMDSDTEYSVSDITSLMDVDYSNQKMSALLTQLVDANKLVRTEIKRKAYFSKA